MQHLSDPKIQPSSKPTTTGAPKLTYAEVASMHIKPLGSKLPNVLQSSKQTKSAAIVPLKMTYAAVAAIKPSGRTAAPITKSSSKSMATFCTAAASETTRATPPVKRTTTPPSIQKSSKETTDTTAGGHINSFGRSVAPSKKHSSQLMTATAAATTTTCAIVPDELTMTPLNIKQMSKEMTDATAVLKMAFAAEHAMLTTAGSGKHLMKTRACKEGTEELQTSPQASKLKEDLGNVKDDVLGESMLALQTGPNSNVLVKEATTEDTILNFVLDHERNPNDKPFSSTLVVPKLNWNAKPFYPTFVVPEPPVVPNFSQPLIPQQQQQQQIFYPNSDMPFSAYGYPSMVQPHTFQMQHGDPMGFYLPQQQQVFHPNNDMPLAMYQTTLHPMQHATPMCLHVPQQQQVIDPNNGMPLAIYQLMEHHNPYQWQDGIPTGVHVQQQHPLISPSTGMAPSMHFTRTHGVRVRFCGVELVTISDSPINIAERFRTTALCLNRMQPESGLTNRVLECYSGLILDDVLDRFGALMKSVERERSIRQWTMNPCYSPTTDHSHILQELTSYMQYYAENVTFMLETMGNINWDPLKYRLLESHYSFYPDLFLSFLTFWVPATSANSQELGSSFISDVVSKAVEFYGSTRNSDWQRLFVERLVELGGVALIMQLYSESIGSLHSTRLCDSLIEASNALLMFFEEHPAHPHLSILVIAQLANARETLRVRRPDILSEDKSEYAEECRYYEDEANAHEWRDDDDSHANESIANLVSDDNDSSNNDEHDDSLVDESIVNPVSVNNNDDDSLANGTLADVASGFSINDDGDENESRPDGSIVKLVGDN